MNMNENADVKETDAIVSVNQLQDDLAGLKETILIQRKKIKKQAEMIKELVKKVDELGSAYAWMRPVCAGTAAGFAFFIVFSLIFG